jgi:hypothetical protein
MNIKLVYASIIDEKISSFAQALIEIFNFYFGCVTYGPPYIIWQSIYLFLLKYMCRHFQIQMSICSDLFAEEEYLISFQSQISHQIFRFVSSLIKFTKDIFRWNRFWIVWCNEKKKIVVLIINRKWSTSSSSIKTTLVCILFVLTFIDICRVPLNDFRCHLQ